MDINLLNLVLAFLEGLGLIISPCILPILPIMLSGSIEGGKKRPIGIIIGFVAVFALFTLFSHLLVTFLGINLNILRNIAFILIALFGVVMMSNYLTEKFAVLTQNVASVGTQLTTPNKNPEGFVSGVILGGLVSLIWAPCAGPILAAVLIQIAIQKTALGSFLILICFALGSVLPMILIALLGKKLFSTMQFFKKHADGLRKLLGAIITVSALCLAYINYANPSLLAFSPTPNVHVSTNTQETAKKSTVEQSNSNGKLINSLFRTYSAPSLGSDHIWINSPPLNLEQLKGKVVLIDFWTYSCINCIRTLPYLVAWDKAYRDKGLVIIGVHTPEFEFEKDVNNVREAVKRFNIQYPVVIDSGYDIWRNFNNQYWPAHYLIDKNGKVVYEHFGEGEYDTTEHDIQVLLNTSNAEFTKPVQQAKQADILYHQTPETYFGYARSERFANEDTNAHDKITSFSFPKRLSEDQWALNGLWVINPQYIMPKSPNAAIKLYFSGKHVYLVAGSENKKPAKVMVFLNNKIVTDNAGADVHNGILIIKAQCLYNILNFPNPTKGELTLLIQSPEVNLYTFTFG